MFVRPRVCRRPSFGGAQRGEIKKKPPLGHTRARSRQTLIIIFARLSYRDGSSTETIFERRRPWRAFYASRNGRFRRGMFSRKPGRHRPTRTTQRWSRTVLMLPRTRRTVFVRLCKRVRVQTRTRTRCTWARACVTRRTERTRINFFAYTSY